MENTQHIHQSGGRKRARARVNLVPSTSQDNNIEPNIIVNGKSAENYFQNNPRYLQSIFMVYDLVKTQKQYRAIINVQGGGSSAQAQATQLALCKSFSELFPNLKPYFRERKLLTRDARVPERKKYGLKKARKAPQFSKR